MNPLLKGGIAFGAVAGTSGAVYGAYNAMQTTPKTQKTTTYADAFKDTLLPTSGGDHDANWKARLTSLQKVEPVTNLIESLQGLKTAKGDNQWEELRTWCANNINNPSKGNQDKEFQSIQSYCTYSVKEKLGEKVILESTSDPDGKWIAAHKKLTSIANLNTTLKNAKNTAVETGKKQVKDWCDSMYSNPFKGEEDPDFVLAKQVCVFE